MASGPVSIRPPVIGDLPPLAHTVGRQRRRCGQGLGFSPRSTGLIKITRGRECEWAFRENEGELALS